MIVASLGILMVILGGVLVAALLELWPVLEPGRDGRGPAPVQDVSLLFGAATVSLGPDTALLVLAVVASALGSYVHAATSFVDYVGNRRLVASWAWWYVLRISIGVALALLFYFAVRGGFFSADASSDDVNPYGVAALAGLAGLFSKQATDKLRELFETLFRVAPGYGDDQRRDNLSNPRPLIHRLEPPQVAAGASGLELTVAGEGFVPGATVRVDGLQSPARFDSDRSLAVALPAEVLRREGSVGVTVVNPAPGGGSSDTAALAVTAVDGLDRAGGGSSTSPSSPPSTS